MNNNMIMEDVDIPYKEGEYQFTEEDDLLMLKIVKRDGLDKDFFSSL